MAVCISESAKGIRRIRETAAAPDPPERTGQAAAIPSHELVKRIDERRQSEHAKKAAERSGELELGKEHNTPASVTSDRRAIAEY